MIDKKTIVECVEKILIAIGEDPKRPGLIDTPTRVANMYEEIFSGMEADPSVHERLFDDCSYESPVVLKGIQFYSMCEHHMVPFRGKVHLAYIPSDRIIGISKLARIVDVFAKRLQVQENLSVQIAEAIEQLTHAQGVAVIIEAEHLCMSMRGVKKQDVQTVTMCFRGEYKTNDDLRKEIILELRQSS